MMTIAEIRRVLGAHRAREAEGKRRAAVAAVLREDGDALRLLFIERARCEGDPWSGHLAFPGGRVESFDRECRCAAERETMEEVGLDLGVSEYLGRLDDVTGATLPVVVSGFVYGVVNPGRLRLNYEVREAFWARFEDVVDPARRAVRTFRVRGAERGFPAVDLLGPGRPVLWGLTYRLVAQLVGLVGFEMP